MAAVVPDGAMVAPCQGVHANENATPVAAVMARVAGDVPNAMVAESPMSVEPIASDGNKEKVLTHASMRHNIHVIDKVYTRQQATITTTATNSYNQQSTTTTTTAATTTTTTATHTSVKLTHGPQAKNVMSQQMATSPPPLPRATIKQARSRARQGSMRD